MADTLQIDLVSPAKLLLSEATGMVVVPGVEGYFGVLPNHMPLVSSLRPGVVSVHEDVNAPAAKKFFVDGGFAEVNPESCTLLVENALPLEDIDDSLISERRTAAEEQLEKAMSDEDRAAAERALTVVEEMARAARDAA